MRWSPEQEERVTREERPGEKRKWVVVCLNVEFAGRMEEDEREGWWI